MAFSHIPVPRSGRGTPMAFSHIPIPQSGRGIPMGNMILSAGREFGTMFQDSVIKPVGIPRRARDFKKAYKLPLCTRL